MKKKDKRTVPFCPLDVWPFFMAGEGIIITVLFLPAYLHQGLSRGDVIHVMFQCAARIAGMMACISTAYSGVLYIMAMRQNMDAAVNGAGFHETIPHWAPTLAFISAILPALLSAFFHLFIAFLAGWLIGFICYASRRIIVIACVTACSIVIFMSQVSAALFLIAGAFPRTNYFETFEGYTEPNFHDFILHLRNPVADVVHILLRDTVAAENPEFWSLFIQSWPNRYGWWDYAMLIGALLFTLLLAIGLPLLLKRAMLRIAVKVE